MTDTQIIIHAQTPKEKGEEFPSQKQEIIEESPPSPASPSIPLSKMKLIFIILVPSLVAVILLVSLLSYYGTKTNEILIPIISTNDIHGKFYEVEYTSSNGVKYSYGGLKFFEIYVRLLREEFGPEGCLYLDGGDQIQGAVESEFSDGQIIYDFFNKVQPNATTFGNHEFEEKFDFMVNMIANAKYPYLISNMISKTTGSRTPLGDNQLTSKVFKMKTKKGAKVKIGVIGVAYYLPDYTGTEGKGWDDIQFVKYVEAIENEAKEIRKKESVDAMVLLIHIGLECGKNYSYGNYTQKTKQEECNTETELYKVLSELKEGTIDAVVSADTHYEVHHWVKGIPVISGVNNGQYSNIMYLAFEKKGFGKYKLKKDKIKLEGALPICEKVFENYPMCDPQKDTSSLGQLVSMTFHGKNMEASDEMKELWESYREEYDKLKETVFELQGTKEYYGGREGLNGDEPFSNMIADFLKEITKAEITTINGYGFRTIFVPGKINIADIRTMFPYDNYVCKTKFKGSEIKKIFETVQFGEKKIYPTSGLKQVSDGKKLTSIQFYNNGVLEELVSDREYTLGSTNFVLQNGGGDDFASVSDVLKNKEIECETYLFADKFIEWTKNKGVINIDSYYSEDKRRFIVNSQSA